MVVSTKKHHNASNKVQRVCVFKCSYTYINHSTESWFLFHSIVEDVREIKTSTSPGNDLFEQTWTI